MGNLVTCSYVRRIGSEHTFEPLSNYTNSQLINPPDKERGQTCSQWVCHAINKISYICVLSKPPKTTILRPPFLQNYLAHACCMKAALR